MNLYNNDKYRQIIEIMHIKKVPIEWIVTEGFLQEYRTIYDRTYKPSWETVTTKYHDFNWDRYHFRLGVNILDMGT